VAYQKIVITFTKATGLLKKCKKPDSDKSYERFRLIWNEVVYEPGEIQVLAYNNGEFIGKSIIKTAGEPFQIKLTPDRSELKSTGEDLSYILVEVFDEDGNLCPLADNPVCFNIDGPSVIEAVGNGNPQSVEPFVSNQRKLFFGKAMLIIKTLKSRTGKITVTATSAGLKPAETSLISN
jgi:beta-galactosidase